MNIIKYYKLNNRNILNDNRSEGNQTKYIIKKG